MNKTDLIKAVATATGITQQDARKTLEAFLDTIVKEVSQGGHVSLVGFGVFNSQFKAKRVGHNPRTGASLEIQAKTAPVFKAGLYFKNSVKQLAE